MSLCVAHAIKHVLQVAFAAQATSPFQHKQQLFALSHRFFQLIATTITTMADLEDKLQGMDINEEEVDVRMITASSSGSNVHKLF